MTEKKPSTAMDGYQPSKNKDNTSIAGNAKAGYQPETGQQKPATKPPPKKP